MVFLEMSRHENHGGGNWSFGNCVWAPTHKYNDASWPFWSKVSDIQEGDIVIHLRGRQPNARFIGYSIASCDGFETKQRPPDPGKWSFARSFYKADIENFTPFLEPINLTDVFSSREPRLAKYFEENKARQRSKNIFFVRQAGRLQCLNGAYLSDVEKELFNILFISFEEEEKTDSALKPLAMSLNIGTQIKSLEARIGQSEFSAKVKLNYDGHCCFPECAVNDPRFLIGAHIARWSDNESWRGRLDNGLCLCLMHDKAFEIGLFTVDDQGAIYLNPRAHRVSPSITAALSRYHGMPIRPGQISPAVESLIQHWIRTDIDPIA